MKKWIFCFTLCLSSFIVAAPMQNHHIDADSLSQLTALFGISEDADLIAETQRLWLRKPHQERWEMDELSNEKRCFVLNWGKKQGFFDPWMPLEQNYDKALILGATTGVMQLRLNYLKDLWNEGIRFNEVVWLTGERPLDLAVDKLTDRCSNESEAARILWAESDLPEELASLPLVFIEVPMKVVGASVQRPTTVDTLVAWLKVDTNPCKALFVSSQPFCNYQHAVIEAYLPETFLFDCVGPGVDPTRHPKGAAILLDAVTRQIYQESLKN